MSGRVLVYRGEGAGWRSVRSTCESLERLLRGPLQQFVRVRKVDTISTAELLDGSWARDAVLLVMPGGADLPYCRHLNGRGNRIIKDFVEQDGGSYLGLCAGAYYGSARVCFEPGTPLEVIGDRELAFFPGVARGAAYPGFDYLTEAGAVAAQMEFTVPEALASHRPGLKQQPHLQQAQLQQAAAATASRLPSGTTAAAVQASASCTAFDYCNGGPYFMTLDGSPDVGQLPGVAVLASYCAVPLPPSNAALQQQQQQQQQAQDLGLQQQQQQKEFSRRVAAVRCRVGRGVAVLCGTHPELGPEWLDPCGESNAVEGPRPHPTAQATGTSAAAAAAASAAAAELAAAGGAAAQQPVQQVVAVGGVQLQVQELSAASLAGAPGSLQQSMPVVCRDAVLAAHAQRLRQQLQDSQPARDLLLCSLLYEALVPSS